MTKKPTVTTISTGYYSTTALNNNFEALRDAFDNTVSLDGSTPNAMQADFDLNDYKIINGRAEFTTLKLNGKTVGDFATAFDWRGAWTTSTSYRVNDVVSNNGNSYICILDHTSGATFSSDLSGGKWELLASKGESGAGTGDLLASNNLSDLDDPATALGNLGLTATAAELNYTDGVTSDIQTQLNSKVGQTSATGSAELPAGTTAQRDVTPSAGYLRFNSTEGAFEGYDGTEWETIRGDAVAIAEGATGAPKVENKALNGLFIGRLDVSGRNPAGFNDIGNFEQIVFTGVLRTGFSFRYLQIRFSSDNGLSFGAWQTIDNTDNGKFVQCIITKTRQNASFFGYTPDDGSMVDFISSLTIPLDANAFQVQVDTDFSDNISAHFFITGGR